MNWSLLLSPPVAFIIVLAAAVCVFGIFSRLALRKGRVGAGAKPYACGEETPDQKVQPDYSQFFPFAFFFTILHVVTLIVATSPTGIGGSMAFAILYVFGALLALYILFRR